MELVVVVVMFLGSIIIGNLVGLIKVGTFSLGKSAILFVALFLSYLAATIKVDLSIDPIILKLSLLGFIGSVGVLASKAIKEVLKEHGLKFVIMAIVICFTGFITASVIAFFDQNVGAYISGIFVGALTSSPGLASVLENVNDTQAAFVGTAYAIAYIPGVVTVIIFTQLIAKGSNKDVTNEDKVPTRKGFNIVAFALILLVGFYVGKLSVFHVSLGVTGGVLISSLVLGSASARLEFDDQILNHIKTVSLSIFLAYVGLKYGREIVAALHNVGLSIFLYSFVIAIASVVLGFTFGKYVLKLPDDLLVGSICGGMTSTPGLASATDNFEGSNVVSAYGATYPVALILMITLANLLLT